jgi:NAD(P)-dependent dehydrogenase (short-subunit alcohol dehydrogenase family)
MDTLAPQELLNFSGKTVIVTGASQGIGAGIARRFAQAGAQLVIHYRSGSAAATALVEDIVSDGGRAVAIAAELTDPASVEALIAESVAAFGALDVMINNAGIFPNAALLELSHGDWQAMIAANVDTAFLGTQAAGLYMRDNGGGAIINLGSINAMNPGSVHSHYNSAKAAVLMFTRSAAQELGPFGIRVNSVSPGLIARPGIEEAWPEGVARWEHKAPLGRMGSVEDIGDACLFLASPAARWITGVDLTVDGGVLSSMIY